MCGVFCGVLFFELSSSNKNLTFITFKYFINTYYSPLTSMYYFCTIYSLSSTSKIGHRKRHCKRHLIQISANKYCAFSQPSAQDHVFQLDKPHVGQNVVQVITTTRTVKSRFLEPYAQGLMNKNKNNNYLNKRSGAEVIPLKSLAMKGLHEIPPSKEEENERI